MIIKNSKLPPVILRLVETPFTALENLLPMAQSNLKTISQPNLPPSTDEDFDKFLLYQYIMYLYIDIFVFPETSFVYKKLINDGFDFLRSHIHSVKDSSLCELLKTYIDSGNHNTQITDNVKIASLLDIAIRRVRPAEYYQGLDSIISIVLAVYGIRIKNTGDVVVHRITLQKIEGYDDPTFVLNPYFDASFNTTKFENIQSPFWKFMFSLNNDITANGDFIRFLYQISALALPLDPTNLVGQMKMNMTQNTKTGVPFINYLAMYLREQAMGLDYNLSPMADSRRILLKRAHQFFGVGGVIISDYNYAKYFLSSFYDSEDGQRADSLSKEDQVLIASLLRGRPDAAIKFTKSISYEEALEALKPATDPTKKVIKTPLIKKKTTLKNPLKGTSEDSSKNTVKDTSSDTSGDTDEDDEDDSFENDPDIMDIKNGNVQASDKTADDNIDRTSDVGQDPAVVNTKVFFPLALPTETIDDHLLRIKVLRYVCDKDKDPEPDITPENLEVLKYWCEIWLFIASIDQTKKLLAQLNLTSQLKELK